MAADAGSKMARTTWLLAMACLLSLLAGRPAFAAGANAAAPAAELPVLQLPLASSIGLKPYLMLHKVDASDGDLAYILDRLDQPGYWHSPLQRDRAVVLDESDAPFWLQLRIHNPTSLTQRLWIEQPHRVLAFGLIYFACLGAARMLLAPIAAP